MLQLESASYPAHTDEDLLELAKPGHGVPSQDPDPSAQYPIGRELAAEEERTVFVGAGVMLGAALGAVVGIAAAGPVGVFAGSMVGGVVGGFGSRALGTTKRATG
jgi:hypothetical protein